MSVNLTIQPNELPEALVAAAPYAQGLTFEGPLGGGAVSEYRAPWRKGVKRVFIGARRDKDAAAMLKGLIVSYVRRHWAAVQRKAASK